MDNTENEVTGGNSEEEKKENSMYEDFVAAFFECLERLGTKETNRSTHGIHPFARGFILHLLILIIESAQIKETNDSDSDILSYKRWMINTQINMFAINQAFISENRYQFSYEDLQACLLLGEEIKIRYKHLECKEIDELDSLIEKTVKTLLDYESTSKESLVDLLKRLNFDNIERFYFFKRIDIDSSD